MHEFKKGSPPLPFPPFAPHPFSLFPLPPIFLSSPLSPFPRAIFNRRASLHFAMPPTAAPPAGAVCKDGECTIADIPEATIFSASQNGIWAAGYMFVVRWLSAWMMRSAGETEEDSLQAVCKQ